MSLPDQTVTVLATRDPNCLLVQHRVSGVDLLVDFGFKADDIVVLEGMLERLGTSAGAIGAVLMTHMHGDHFRDAGLRAFLERRPADAPPLPFYVHRDEPVHPSFDLCGLDVRRFDETPFAVTGPRGSVTVQPVRMTHTPGTCAFRIGDDFLGCDSSLREVFSDRVLRIINPPGGSPLRGLYVDMQALDREAVLASDFTGERKRNVLAWHGLVSDMVSILERPELRTFFVGLKRLVCLHVTAGVNDASGRTNARLITEARDRLGFTFEVPVVPAGIQDLAPPCP